jgi:hypothetical protein
MDKDGGRSTASITTAEDHPNQGGKSTSVNALVEVFICQGEPMPVLLPKKWKVWWVTTCSIFFLWLIANGTVFIYYAKWGSATWNKCVYFLQAF